MKIFKFALVVFLTTTSILSAQDKQVTLDEIWGGAFRQEYLQALRSLNNGEEYVVQDYDRSAKTMNVDVYSYKTGKKPEL